jgi:hypothetical protein
MSIVQLPVSRLRGQVDRLALQSGLATGRPKLHVLSKFEREMAGKVYCDRCAAPIELGAVMHGRGVYCSVECSLEGPLAPA